MHNREKVIKTLAEIGIALDMDGHHNDAHAVRDAISMLKEQETKYGYWVHPTSQDCHCSECGNQPEHEPGGSVPLYDFCPYCGAEMEVKWNA